MKLLDLRAQYESRSQPFDAALRRVVESGMFLDGAEVPALERELSVFLGNEVETIACASGSDALVLALAALGLAPGDEVVVPAFTFAATAEAVVHLGGVPVFCDVDAAGLLSLPLVEAALTPRTRAVIAVSLFGQCPPLEALGTLLSERGIALIEDAAQSFGASRGGRLSGTFGLATTSFFPGKPLGAWGKGGAVFVRDPALARRLRALRNHGQAVRGSHDEVGWNARMDEIQAAVLREKLVLFPGELQRRRELAQLYLELLPSSVRPLFQHPENHSSWSQMTVLVPDRDALRESLSEAGVPTAIHYSCPLHLQPAFRFWKPDFPLPRAEGFSRQILSLPLHPYMSEDDVREVCRLLAMA